MSVARGRLAGLMAAAGASLAIALWAAPVEACSGATVTFEKIRTGAQRIVIGTIVERDAIKGAADRVTLRVEAVIRGVSGRELVLEPPTFMGCDGRIMEPVGSRLIVASAPRFFSVGPAEEMHPYWRLLAGDIVEPAGVDDQDPDHTRLAGLIVDLGGMPAAAVATEGPDPAPIVPPLVLAAVAGAVFFVTLVLLARSRTNAGASR